MSCFCKKKSYFYIEVFHHLCLCYVSSICKPVPSMLGFVEARHATCACVVISSKAGLIVVSDIRCYNTCICAYKISSLVPHDFYTRFFSGYVAGPNPS